LLECYEEFLESANSNEIIHICLHSEFNHRQKVDLISRITSKKSSISSSYICIGNVRLDNDNNENDSVLIEHIEAREKCFKYAADQRPRLPDEISEKNIKMLTKFSILYDLVNISHQNELKQFKSNNEAEFNNNTSEFKKASSFVLYNCARLNAIIEKFESLEESGKMDLKVET
jgi:hypothetical protein